MLAKKFRITKQKDVEDLFKKGRSSFSNIMGVKKLDTQENISKFVVVVSTKVSKKAVIRNKIKRQLSEICRTHYTKIKPGQNFFILALPVILKQSYNDIDKAFIKHLRQLKAFL